MNKSPRSWWLLFGAGSLLVLLALVIDLIFTPALVRLLYTERSRVEAFARMRRRLSSATAAFLAR